MRGRVRTVWVQAKGWKWIGRRTGGYERAWMRAGRRTGGREREVGNEWGEGPVSKSEHGVCGQCRLEMGGEKDRWA